MNAVLTKPLKKEKAVEILNTLLCHQHLTENDTNKNDLNHSLPVIDFELVKSNMGGSEELMQAMLTMFLQTLPDEIAKLQQCYEHEDWYQLKATVHQLKGGASYCGTLQLNHVCTRLEESILTSSKETIARLYEQMLVEIVKVKELIQGHTKKIELKRLSS
jgi:HPt (histidine-containing phosphotransfer) domain-containing protein